MLVRFFALALCLVIPGSDPAVRAQGGDSGITLSTSVPSASAKAQASPAVPTSPAAQTITLEQVVAMAESNSPRLRGAAAGVQQATASVATARARVNPSVEVFGGEQYARAVPTPGVPGLMQHYAAYQLLEIPAERSARRNTAQFSATASRFAQAGITLSVVAEAKRAFYTVLRAREEVEHTQETLGLVEDLRRRVQVEVDVGEKGRLELTRAEAEVARARYAVRSAQLGLANATALLRIAIAAPPDTPLLPQGDLDARSTLPPLPTLREQVLRTHPAVAESQANVQAAQSNLVHERASRIPQPTFFGEFENQPDLRYWRTGVTVPLPLWDRRRGRIEGAIAGISQQTAVLDQRRLELISATERAYEAYQLADQQVSSLQSGDLRAAESAVTGAQAAYRFGERGLVEVLDAQRVLQNVRDDLLNAQFARQSALVDLQELGALTPRGTP